MRKLKLWSESDVKYMKIFQISFTLYVIVLLRFQKFRILSVSGVLVRYYSSSGNY